ncbi:hypothetical protein BN946_scf184787.g20 [Trametes cinnabarina]|uniref:F-box domain-containing protein n=1 Tax=Pycnoporus cinnabarinus TaxID=5643 RepID=A0A060STC8_PYCCI|nr:hypothetical protein BN946_scf184787.g20 [Trametes cinnabarina]
MESRPVLPDDILFEIFAAADRPDAVRMLTVSRFLYTEGPRVILRQPITIQLEEQVPLLLAFLSADHGRRLAFVRAIVINFKAVCAVKIQTFHRLLLDVYDMANLSSLSIRILSEEQLAHLIALLNLRADSGKRGLYEVLHSLELWIWRLDNSRVALDLVGALPRICNLHTLDIIHCEEVLESHPDLALTFAAMASIKTLRLTYIVDKGITLLQNLRSQLVHVTLKVAPVGQDEAVWGAAGLAPYLDMHPVALLPPSRSSLQDLTIYDWGANPDVFPVATHVYTNMRRLLLYQFLVPLIVPYICAYPNLAVLEFYPIQPMLLNWDHESIAGCDARRRLNVSEQKASGRTWQYLQYFRGSLVGLYMLGLTCVIEDMFIYVIPETLHYQLDAVLAMARPRRLELTTWPRKLTEPAEEVFATLRTTGCSDLQSLTLFIYFVREDEAVDLSVIMRSLKSSLSGIALQELNLEISLERLKTHPYDDLVAATMMRQANALPTLPSSSLAPDSLCPAELSADEFDLEAWTHSLSNEVASLRRAEITLIGSRGRRKRVTFTSGSLHLEDGL